MLTNSEINKRYYLYDNRWETIDRFTLVDKKDFRVTPEWRRLYAWLCFDEWMRWFCQHSEVRIWHHLWKKLITSEFPSIRYIIQELF